MKGIFKIPITQIILSIIMVVNSYVLDPHQLQSGIAKKVKKSVAVMNKNQLWNSGIIPYEIEGMFDESTVRLITLGMLIWEEYTCIKFVKRSPEVDTAYLAITKLDCGCCYIQNNRGNTGRNEMSLNDGCDKLTIILHELGHVLGLYHEHEHPERDEYVEIKEQNVERGSRQEFGKYSSSEVDTLGQPYDYHSVMHYPSNAFAYLDYLKTIVPKQTIKGVLPKIGNKTRLSDGDISAINTLYQCSDCNRVLKDNKGFFTSPTLTNNNSSGFIICNWKIPIASGSIVVIKIMNLNIPKQPGCLTDFLEVRRGFFDFGTLLGRFCGNHTKILITDGDMTVKYVRFHRPIDNDEGFVANYYKFCIGSKTLSSNAPIIIQSPNYPGVYEPNSDCHWDFTAPKDHKTMIRFDSFSLEPSQNCTYDRFEIGTHNGGEIFGTYCGEDKPSEIVLTSKEFFLSFTSNEIHQSGGFSVTITASPMT